VTIAIIGGGLAGATVATELRKRGHDGPVALFSGEPHLPYERPPLSKDYLLGRKEIDTVFVHDADWYRDNDIDLRVGERVTALRPDDHVLVTDQGETTFSQAVLATGSVPRRLPMADDSGKPVAYLRTIDDSQRLRQAFAARPNVVVIGGGWIGLEVAAAAREADCAVTVHEAAALPLLGVLGAEVAQVFADLHVKHGVDLRLGVPVTAQDLDSADLVVVGIGVTPETSLAEASGLAVDNGLLVDAQLRTSHPDVFAIGDIANHDHPVLGRRVRVEHWDNAIRQGRVVAHNLMGAGEAYERQPYFFTDQYDLGMEYVGHVGPDGYESVAIEGDTGGAFRAYWISDGVVMAAMQVNDWDASAAIKASVGQPYRHD
jgi:3-phenylpropionate/trans-cinnamate dioxygenase ferredoxin reductase subunit